jgi:hypothetical protein
MKSVFISFDQAYHEQILHILNYSNIRGFTRWDNVQGRGSKTGEPHYGSMPGLHFTGAIMTGIPTKRYPPARELKALDATSELMGLRAFVWAVEESI